MSPTIEYNLEMFCILRPPKIFILSQTELSSSLRI